MTLGIDWINLSTAYDHSTGAAYFEIHLRIEFESADTLDDARDAIAQAQAKNDPTLAALKTVLRRELKRAGRSNSGNLAIVKALSLRVDGPLSAGRKKTAGKTGIRKKK